MEIPEQDFLNGKLKCAPALAHSLWSFPVYLESRTRHPKPPPGDEFTNL